MKKTYRAEWALFNYLETKRERFLRVTKPFQVTLRREECNQQTPTE